MKSVTTKSKWIVGIVLLAGIAGVFALRIATMDKGAPPPSISQLHKLNGVPVDLAEVSRRDMEKSIRVVGTLEGIEETNINSQIPMRIKRIYGESGQTVQKNQPLVELDPLSLLMMYSNLESSRIHYDNAKRDLERMRPLHKAGAVSDADWDDLQAAVESAKASLSDNRHAMILYSPISGTMTRVLHKAGDVVHMGEPIVTVSQTHRMKLVAQVAQAKVARIKQGMAAAIETSDPSGETQTIAGEVGLVDLAAHPQTRLFRVELIFDNPDRLLRSGVVREAEIVVASSSDALSLPAGAIIENEGASGVFRVSGDEAMFVPVTTGIANSDWIEITGGLGLGDLAVINGANLLDKTRSTKVVIHHSTNPTVKPQGN